MQVCGSNCEPLYHGSALSFSGSDLLQTKMDCARLALAWQTANGSISPAESALMLRVVK